MVGRAFGADPAGGGVYFVAALISGRFPAAPSRRQRTVEWPADMANDDRAPDGVRLDIWLDVSCLYRTRSEAQKACQSGKIDVNGQQRVIVRGLADRHVAKADAKRLYDDLTPPPTAEEIELRRTERIFRAAMTAPGSPDKRQRRAIRRMKGRD
jgi:ribosome-associated heat shock protein Hsp15